MFYIFSSHLRQCGFNGCFSNPWIATEKYFDVIKLTASVRHQFRTQSVYLLFQRYKRHNRQQGEKKKKNLNSKTEQRKDIQTTWLAKDPCTFSTPCRMLYHVLPQCWGSHINYKSPISGTLDGKSPRVKNSMTKATKNEAQSNAPCGLAIGTLITRGRRVESPSRKETRPLVLGNLLNTPKSSFNCRCRW